MSPYKPKHASIGGAVAAILCRKCFLFSSGFTAMFWEVDVAGNPSNFLILTFYIYLVQRGLISCGTRGLSCWLCPPCPPPHCSLCLAARNGSVSGHWALGQQALMVLSRLLRGNLTVNKICHILSIHSVFIICTSGSRFLLHSRKVCTSPPSHSSAPWHLPLPL